MYIQTSLFPSFKNKLVVNKNANTISFSSNDRLKMQNKKLSLSTKGLSLTRKKLLTYLTTAALAIAAGIPAGINAYHNRAHYKFNLRNYINNSFMSEINPNYTKLIEKHPYFSLIDESLRTTEDIIPNLYYDSKKLPTIGIGHLLSHKNLGYAEILEENIISNHLRIARKNTKLNESVRFYNAELTPNQIFMLYYNDLLTKEKECKELFADNLQGFSKTKVKWSELNIGQKAALIHLAFQVGKNGIAYRIKRDKVTKKIIEKKPSMLLTYIRNGEFDKAQVEFDHARGSFNNKCKRYIEMYLWGNGKVSYKALERLFDKIKDNNKKDIAIRKMKSTLSCITNDIDKKFTNQASK